MNFQIIHFHIHAFDTWLSLVSILNTVIPEINTTCFKKGCLDSMDCGEFGINFEYRNSGKIKLKIKLHDMESHIKLKTLFKVYLTQNRNLTKKSKAESN